MNYDDILTAVENHLTKKGDTEGLELINRMLHAMQTEEANDWIEKEGYITEAEKLQIMWEEEQAFLETETHWYTDQVITKNNRYWVQVVNGRDEYALVETDRHGGFVFQDFHTT